MSGAEQAVVVEVLGDVIPASEFGVAQEVERLTTGPRIGAIIKSVHDFKRQLTALPRIQSDEDNAKAVDTLGALRRLKKDAETARTGMVSWPDKFCSIINSFFKREVKEPVFVMERQLEEAMGRWRKEKQIQAQKEAERLAKENARIEKKLAKVGITTPLPPAPPPKVETVTRGETATAHVQKKWTFAVEDKMLLIKAVAEGREKPEALDVNGRYIDGLVKAGVREIPGIRVYQDEQLRVRT